MKYMQKKYQVKMVNSLIYRFVRKLVRGKN